ncbi:MAG: pyrroline-5-carboxylate reductase family protein, partial [Bacteroidota bacterium]
MNKKIAIIGGGNLGIAIAEGLLKSGFVNPSHLIITKRNIQTLQEIEQRGVMVTNNNEEAVRYADLIILSVKPYQIKEVIQQIKPTLNPSRQLIVSVVTGVTLKEMQEWAGENISLVRA